jgi:hypothetical protein
MADSQKMGKAMSGGRRIDDHSFWAGGKGKDSIAPDGTKTKVISNAEGSGSLSSYEDTEEAIKSSQMMAKKKIHSNPRKSDMRN